MAMLQPITAGQGQTEIYEPSTHKDGTTLSLPSRLSKRDKSGLILFLAQIDRSLRRKRQTEKSNRPTGDACNEQQATEDDDKRLEYDELLQMFRCRLQGG